MENPRGVNYHRMPWVGVVQLVSPGSGTPFSTGPSPGTESQPDGMVEEHLLSLLADLKTYFAEILSAHFGEKEWSTQGKNVLLWRSTMTPTRLRHGYPPHYRARVGLSLTHPTC